MDLGSEKSLQELHHQVSELKKQTPQSNQNSRPGTFQCYSCGGRGHIALVSTFSFSWLVSLATLSLDFSSLLFSVRIGRDFSFRFGLMPVSPTLAGLTVFLSCRHGSHLAIEPARKNYKMLCLG
jgi:hypothetical protein